MKILTGHRTQETAYLVSDYPCGFTRRCSIRYWLEFDKKRGYRFCSQTTNPKKPLDVWNKPKKSVYSKLCMVLYLNEVEHVKVAALTEYQTSGECKKYLEQYREGLAPAQIEDLNSWILAKELAEKHFRDNPIKFKIQHSEPILLSELVKG